jgi:alpha-L-fucosidase
MRNLYMGPSHPKRNTTIVEDNPEPCHSADTIKYGHPSKFGCKDIIPLWKEEKPDPEALMALDKKAGAKYFVNMGSRYDNFWLRDSKIPSWNAVRTGPHKDVVGLWRKSAKAQGLYSRVLEPSGASYTWFQYSHGVDVNGPLAGVPFNDNDPRYQDLYHSKAAPNDNKCLTTNPACHRTCFDGVKELVAPFTPTALVWMFTGKSGVTQDMEWKQTREALVIKKHSQLPLPGIPVVFTFTLKN